MSLTIKDVLAHPAMKRLIFTKNRMDIKNIRDILYVIDSYSDVQKYYVKQKLTEKTTKGQQGDFMHFKECPWAVADDSDDVPNTCDCCLVLISVKI